MSRFALNQITDMKIRIRLPNAIYALCLFVTTFFWLNLTGFTQTTAFPTREIEPYYDLNFTHAERDSLFKNLQDFQKMYEALHKVQLNNAVPMSMVFDPTPAGFTINTKQQPIDWGLPKDVRLPDNPTDLAFYPVYKLAVLVKARKVTSTQLTLLYLSRLKKYADTLQCAILMMEEAALRKARQVDEEIAKGKYRGPLHGIPFGIKDLLSVEGTKTTWGAEPYRDQEIHETATVVRRLEDAGAVLIVKLTMGALAMGDIWYGGVTKNPWDLNQGSSGSSAGSASSTAAGLVGFAIGTETLGSIVSPSTRCGATGLRPSFGRVSRQGAMALSWSMDKIGPICRSALDCAIVLNIIRGTDGLDQHVRNASFNYSAKTDVRKLRVGYLKNHFDESYPTKENDLRSLEILRGLGVVLQPVDLTTSLPLASVRLMLVAEAAAAFDELTRSNRDSLLVNQKKNAWPNSFRSARFVPAVE